MSDCQLQYEQWQTDHASFLDAAQATSAAQADLDAARANEQAALEAAAAATAEREGAEAVLQARSAEQNAANQKADNSYSAWLDCMQIDSADARAKLRRV